VLDDVAVLNLLHDGSIVEIRRVEGDVLLTIEIDYLRTRLSPPGRAILVRLVGCTACTYEPYDGMAASEPDIAEVVRDGDDVRVWGSAGCLILRFTEMSLALDDGAPLTRDALAATARAYWAEWEEYWKR
jgi:hypothetical protein